MVIIRKLEKNKKALKSTIFHALAKDDTGYLLLDIILYHKIARDSEFSNKLYTCIPILHLAIFFCYFARMDRLKFTDWSWVHQIFSCGENMIIRRMMMIRPPPQVN